MFTVYGMQVHNVTVGYTHKNTFSAWDHIVAQITLLLDVQQCDACNLTTYSTHGEYYRHRDNIVY